MYQKSSSKQLWTNKDGVGSLLEIEDTIELFSYAQQQMVLKNSTVFKIMKLDTKVLMLPVISTSVPLMLGLDILILLFALISRASHSKEKSKELLKLFTKLLAFRSRLIDMKNSLLKNPVSLMSLRSKFPILKKFSLKKMKNGPKINLRREDKTIHTHIKENIVDNKIMKEIMSNKSESLSHLFNM